MTAPSRSVTLADHVSLSDDVLMQDVAGEAVLLDLAGERYFGLDAVGTRIWQLIDELGQLQAVHDRLCAEFDADPAQIGDDLLQLVSELVAAGLLKLD